MNRTATSAMRTRGLCSTQRDRPGTGAGSTGRSGSGSPRRVVHVGRPQSDSGFSVGLAQLPTDVRDELIAALQDSTDYTEEAGESGQMFSGEVPGGLGTINVVYIFDEDLWVLATGGSDIGPMKTLAWEVHKDRHTPPKGG